MEEALRIRREEQLPVYTRLGDVHSIAVTQGKIADILASRGEQEEALRIQREEELPVYERLGDVRSIASAQGKIARILFDRGEVEEAKRLNLECLATNRALGNAVGIASAQFDLARIELARLDLERHEVYDAIDRLTESWAIILKTGRAVGIAMIGDVLGQVLAATGDKEQAAGVLQRCLEAYRVLGRHDEAARVEAFIAKLPSL